MIYIHVLRDCAHIVHKHLKGDRKHYRLKSHVVHVVEHASQHG